MKQRAWLTAMAPDARVPIKHSRRRDEQHGCGNTGLSPVAATCMAARMRSLQFPAGSARTLSVAIVQTKNNS
jgi:hypothetical protein